MQIIPSLDRPVAGSLISGEAQHESPFEEQNFIAIDDAGLDISQEDVVDPPTPVYSLSEVLEKDPDLLKYARARQELKHALACTGVRETLNHLNKLTSYGVAWRSHTEEYLDSTGIFKDTLIGILATIAKQERIRRSERAKAAIALLRREGKTERIGRRPIVLNRDRIRQLHAQGLGSRAIAKTPGGISHMTVHRIITA